MSRQVRVGSVVPAEGQPARRRLCSWQAAGPRRRYLQLSIRLSVPAVRGGSDGWLRCQQTSAWAGENVAESGLFPNERLSCRGMLSRSPPGDILAASRLVGGLPGWTGRIGGQAIADACGAGCLGLWQFVPVSAGRACRQRKSPEPFGPDRTRAAVTRYIWTEGDWSGLSWSIAPVGAVCRRGACRLAGGKFAGGQPVRPDGRRTDARSGLTSVSGLSAGRDPAFRRCCGCVGQEVISSRRPAVGDKGPLWVMPAAAGG